MTTATDMNMINELEQSTVVAPQQRLDTQNKLAIEVGTKWEQQAEMEVKQWNQQYEQDERVVDAAYNAYKLKDSEKLAIETMTDADLHAELVHVRDRVFKQMSKTHAVVSGRLIPLCNEIIERFKLPGVSTKDRPNNQPTVEAYFKSIGLNYNTVRSWKYRAGISYALYHAPEVEFPWPPIKDHSGYARSGDDFKKIQQLVNKIVAIVHTHSIDVSAAASDLCLLIGQRLSERWGQNWCDCADGLRTLASEECRAREVSGHVVEHPNAAAAEILTAA
jgi:hypothetical protein